jgi:hypothetical protein
VTLATMSLWLSVSMMMRFLLSCSWIKMTCMHVELLLCECVQVHTVCNDYYRNTILNPTSRVCLLQRALLQE